MSGNAVSHWTLERFKLFGKKHGFDIYSHIKNVDEHLPVQEIVLDTGDLGLHFLLVGDIITLCRFVIVLRQECGDKSLFGNYVRCQSTNPVVATWIQGCTGTYLEDIINAYLDKGNSND